MSMEATTTSAPTSPRIALSGVECRKGGRSSQHGFIDSQYLVPGDTLVRVRYRGRDLRGLYLGITDAEEAPNAGASLSIGLHGGQQLALPGRVRIVYLGRKVAYGRLRLAADVEGLAALGSRWETAQFLADQEFVKRANSFDFGGD